MALIEAKFKFEQETKGALRYREVDERGIEQAGAKNRFALFAQERFRAGRGLSTDLARHRRSRRSFSRPMNLALVPINLMAMNQAHPGFCGSVYQGLRLGPATGWATRCSKRSNRSGAGPFAARPRCCGRYIAGSSRSWTCGTRTASLQRSCCSGAATTRPLARAPRLRLNFIAIRSPTVRAGARRSDGTRSSAPARSAGVRPAHPVLWLAQFGPEISPLPIVGNAAPRPPCARRWQEFAGWSCLSLIKAKIIGSIQLSSLRRFFRFPFLFLSKQVGAARTDHAGTERADGRLVRQVVGVYLGFVVAMDRATIDEQITAAMAADVAQRHGLESLLFANRHHASTTSPPISGRPKCFHSGVSRMETLCPIACASRNSVFTVTFGLFPLKTFDTFALERPERRAIVVRL
jgi:hypothetical protein